MSNYNLNLIDGIQPPTSHLPKGHEIAKKIKKPSRIFFRLLIILLVITIIFSTNTIVSQDSVINNLGKLSFWEGVIRLVTGQDKILRGELSDRINILLLGMGGADHEGPYLTDTIILASLKPSTNQLALLSIPRDLYVPVPNYGWRKINAANALGTADSGDGGKLTSQVINNIFKVPVHYWAKIDFNFFREMIDQLGGIDITVDHSFDDTQFPGPNYTYRVVSFKTGLQTMNGQRTLEFVRSRHGNNNQGSDFSRSRRQQKVLFAVKQKVEKLNLMQQPQKIWQLYNTFNKNIDSNLDLSHAIKLAKLISLVGQDKIITQVLSAGPGGPLKAEIALNGAYILRPKSGDFNQIAQIAQNILGDQPTPALFGQTSQNLFEQAQAESISLEEQEENIEEDDLDYGSMIGEIKIPQVIILNGTHISGLAGRASQSLSSNGFKVLKIGNAPNQNQTETIIYSKTSDNSSLNQLISLLQVEIIKEELPNDLATIYQNHSFDFLIVLGQE